jgi:hypothetical protein
MDKRKTMAMQVEYDFHFAPLPDIVASTFVLHILPDRLGCPLGFCPCLYGEYVFNFNIHFLLGPGNIGA